MSDYINTERLEAEIAQLKAQVIYLMNENKKLKEKYHLLELKERIDNLTKDVEINLDEKLDPKDD